MAFLQRSSVHRLTSDTRLMRWSRWGREELPFAQGVPGRQLSVAAEDNARAGHQVPHGACHQHFAGKGSIRNPARDLDRDAGKSRIADLTFTGMDARAAIDTGRGKQLRPARGRSGPRAQAPGTSRTNG